MFMKMMVAFLASANLAIGLWRLTGNVSASISLATTLFIFCAFLDMTRHD